MAMTYTSLIAAKGTAGAIATWVNYTLLDTVTIVDEAQSLIWSLLRCREMMTELTFSMAANAAKIALPSRFLDPIGRLYLTSFNSRVRHKDSAFVQGNRTFTETSGTLGADPFTTTSGSDSVNVTLVGHGFNQESLFNTSGATAFNGATINATFPITEIVDDDNFTIDISKLGSTPNASGSGGGSAVEYICDNLVAGIPVWYGVWDEYLHFDQAFTQKSLCKLQYYRAPAPLAATTNETNFVTSRYPQLMRVACMTSAADFMKDDTEYQKGMTRLTAIVQRINVENDMMMRGMEIDTDTP